MTKPKDPKDYLPRGRPYSIETEEQAEAALKSFCEHISAGKPQFSWYIDSELVRCCDVTLLRTMKEKPNLFDSVLKDKAFKESFAIWFEKGRKMVDGEIKGSYSPQVWQCIMKNMFSRFGWWVSEDQKETPDTSYIGSLQGLFSAIKESSSKPSKEDTAPQQHPEE